MRLVEAGAGIGQTFVAERDVVFDGILLVGLGSGIMVTPEVALAGHHIGGDHVEFDLGREPQRSSRSAWVWGRQLDQDVVGVDALVWWAPRR